ncbi:hypothetical protein [Sedimentibacter sp.]|uniref:hypothetical protein n=1 Tax=Sedimentibacter sp. TaxID=1960295 RepID=UPI0028A8657A|nr:hypothetical protein [Sedimentibacter sp.]
MPSDLPRLVTRVPEDLNNKFLAICEIEDRKTSNLLGYIVKKYVAEYEELNGELLQDSNGKYIIAKPKLVKKPKSSTSKSG